MSRNAATVIMKRAAVKPLVPGMRRLLYVAAVLVLLAGFQLFVFTDRTASYFAWTIRNPLGAAFLGAGYWASVGFEAVAARQRIWANARIAVPTVLVFTVLTLVLLPPLAGVLKGAGGTDWQALAFPVGFTLAR